MLTQDGADGCYVNKSGDTITCNLTVNRILMTDKITGVNENVYILTIYAKHPGDVIDIYIYNGDAHITIDRNTIDIRNNRGSRISFTPDDVEISTKSGRLYVSSDVYFDVGDNIKLNGAVFGEVTLAQYIKKVMS